MVSKGKHGRKTMSALGDQFDNSSVGDLARRIDNVGNQVRTSRGFTGRIVKGAAKLLTGGRFGRWVGKIGMNSTAKLLRKVGLGKAADFIKVIAARNGFFSKIIKFGAGAFIISKLKNLFSKKGKNEPDENGNPPENLSDPLNDKKLEKDILKKDNLERFKEIQNENKTKELATESVQLKVEADKAKSKRDKALGKVIDPNDPAQVQAKADEINRANAELVDTQSKKLDTLNQKLDNQADAIKNAREEAHKLHISLSDRIKAIYQNLKSKLSDKADNKKQTFFGWIKSTLGKLFRGVAGLAMMLTTILTGMAVPKLKEGWNWVKDKTKGLFGGSDSTKTDEKPKSESVDEIISAEADSKVDDNKVLQIDTKATEPQEAGMGTLPTLLMGGGAAGMAWNAWKNRNKGNVAEDVAESVAEDAALDATAKKVTKATAKTATKDIAKTTAKKPGFWKRAWSGIKSVAKKAKKAIISKALGTKIGQKLAKISLKSIGKLSAKAVGKSVLKKLPLIGLLAGIGFAIPRAIKKDWLSAAGELVSGIASCFPGIGTAASAIIDAGLLAKDMTSEEDDGTRVEVDDDGKLKSTSVLDDKPTANPDSEKTTQPAQSTFPKSVQDEYSKMSNQGKVNLAMSSSTKVQPSKMVEPWSRASYSASIAQSNPSKKAEDTLTKKDIGEFEKRIKKSTDQIFSMQEMILSNQFVDNTKGFKINGQNRQLNG